MAFIVGITSCDPNLLDKKPLDSISQDAVFNDPVFLQGYVYDVYNGIKPQWKPGTGGYEALTDVAIGQPETHEIANGLRNYMQGILSGDNITDLTTVWADEYSSIRKANIFFENVDKSTISPPLVKGMKGEMYFLRAWMYFELMRTFGGVPIIKNSFDLNSTSFNVPRNSFDECAKFVLSELELSISALAGSTVVPGKINKAAAMALKARILLYLASALNNPTKDLTKWQAAEVATKAVIDAGYTLHSTYDDLFKKPLKTDEVIFGKAFTPANRIPGWGNNYDYWPTGFDAQHRILPTQTFVDIFQLKNGQYPYQADGVTINSASGYDPKNPFKNRDPRFYSSVLYPGCDPVSISDGAKSTVRTYEFWEDANPNADNGPPYLNPNKIDPKNGQELADYGRDSKTNWIKGGSPFFWKIQTGYAFRKFCDFTGPRASFDYDYAQVTVFMRLTEFYLNYAEIQIALGNEALAREYINRVRRRPSTNMPDITSTGAELLRVYRNERAIELNLEDFRFYDLMRWKAAPGNVDAPTRGLTQVTMDWTGAKAGDLLGILSYTFGDLTDATIKKNPWKGDYYYLFPIPNTEIKKSNGAIIQNPGY